MTYQNVRRHRLSAETQQTLVSAQNDLDEVKSTSRWRDRNLFFLSLGGDRGICERARSLRRETRRGERKVHRDGVRSAAKENEILRVLHNGLKRCDPAYQARSAADVDASEVSNRIQAVRQHAAGLNRKVRQHGTLSPVDIKNLNVTLPGSEADYQPGEAAGLPRCRHRPGLHRQACQGPARAVTKQAKADEEERIRLLHQERARFK